MQRKLVLPLGIACYLVMNACTSRESVASQSPANLGSKATLQSTQISQTVGIRNPLTRIQTPLVFDISLRGKTEAGGFESIPARLEVWPASPGDPNPIRIALFLPVTDQVKLGNGSIFWQSYSPGQPDRKEHYSLVRVQGTQVQMDLVPSGKFRSDMMWMFVKETRNSVTPKKATMVFSIQGNRVTGQIQAAGISDLSLREEPNSIYEAEFSGKEGALLPADVEGLRKLKVQSGDSWEQVVTKAIRLREMGLTDSATESFARYGKMFSAKDQTASLYSEVAQQFTRQIRALSLEGGVYIYQIVPTGSAANAGLQVGDIVVEYGGSPITGMDDLIKIRDGVPKGGSLPLTYLRMTKDGQFQRRAAKVTNPMGAGFMPI